METIGSSTVNDARVEPIETPLLWIIGIVWIIGGLAFRKFLM